MASIALSEPNWGRTSRAHNLVCAAIAALGTAATSGWILRSPGLISLFPGIPMVFDSGACFLLFSVAFWLTRRPGAAARRTRTVLAFVPMLLCAAVLAELLLGRSLGVDFGFLHTWYDYGNAQPGRMAPNSAIGFILIGAGLLTADRVTSRNRGIGAMVLTFCVLAVGLTGLVGYALTPDLLFDWARSARMALPTATGLILSSFALHLMWSESRWYISHRYFREDEKIRILGPATLTVVTITAALSGFVLQQNAFEKILSSKLQSVLHDRSLLLNAAVAQRTQTAFTADRFARLAQAGRKILLEPNSASAAISAINAELIAANLRGIAVENGAGEVVKRFGNAGATPGVAAALGKGLELAWDGELIFRARTPLVSNGERIGSIVMEQSTGSLGTELFDTGNLGETGEVAACIQRSTDILCFPGSRHRIPFTVALSADGSRRLPIQLAMSGLAGDVVAVDYRGQNVVAAYGSLAPGLGIVVKQDAVEVYATIRQSLKIGMPMFLVIALLGARLLFLQLKPLTAQMVASETRANERELQLRTLIETVADGIFTFDADCLIEDVNPAICEIFGYEASGLIGKRTSILLPDKSHDATYGRLHEDLKRGLGVLVGQRNVKLSGQRKDGSEFPLELTISSFSGTRSFVGVARDITERMEAERKLTALGQYDSLTALPNRSLFLDRLKRAAARMERSNTAIALMFIDVDGFKEINDTFGHRGGDDLLIQFAQRLTGAVRDSDTVARLAGDEFTVILEGLSEPLGESQRVADKIIASLRRPFSLRGNEVSVTASLGLVIQVKGGFDTGDLLARADAAMYAAKHAGKNQVVAA
jgi:diguanylate cyclase (GGDEF)-like protein/PAS domain S-box-containing protein